MASRLILLEELQQSAISRSIPIMEIDGIEFLIQTLKKYECKNCLEIGSAVGYSAMMMCLNIEKFNVETIELNVDRYNEAVENIHKNNLSSQITIHHDDALLFDVSKLQGKYDCLFIDAAKAQYQNFFEKYISFIDEDGICIVDNLDFHGMIFDIDNIKNRNTKQLVKKIKRFKDWIENNPQYIVEYYSVGDGVCIIKRR